MSSGRGGRTSRKGAGSQPKRSELLRKEARGRRNDTGWKRNNEDEVSSLGLLQLTPSSSPENNMGSHREVNHWGETPTHNSKQLSLDSDDDDDGEEESEEERDNLKRKISQYADENAKLQEIIQRLKGVIDNQQRRTTYLEEEQRRSLQEAAATEMVLTTTYEKVGKFARKSLFHYKKFAQMGVLWAS